MSNNNKTHTYLLMVLFAIVLIPVLLNLVTFVMITALGLLLKFAPYILTAILGYSIMRFRNERNKK